MHNPTKHTGNIFFPNTDGSCVCVSRDITASGLDPVNGTYLKLWYTTDCSSEASSGVICEKKIGGKLLWDYSIPILCHMSRTVRGQDNHRQK